MSLTMATVVCNSFARDKEMEAQWPGVERTELSNWMDRQQLLLTLMDIFSLSTGKIIVSLDVIRMVFDVSSNVRKWLLQDRVNWITRSRWVSTRMETFSSRIMAIVEFKSFCWWIILVVGLNRRIRSLLSKEAYFDEERRNINVHLLKSKVFSWRQIYLDVFGKDHSSIRTEDEGRRHFEKNEEKKNSSRRSLFSFMTIPFRSDDDNGDNEIQFSRCGSVHCFDHWKKLSLIFSDNWNEHRQRFSHLCSFEIFRWVILSSLHNDRFRKESIELLSKSFVFGFVYSQCFDHFQLWRIIFDLLLVQSFHQPRFCSNASWNPNATTFASSSIVGTLPLGLFRRRTPSSCHAVTTVRLSSGKIMRVELQPEPFPPVSPVLSVSSWAVMSTSSSTQTLRMVKWTDGHWTALDSPQRFFIAHDAGVYLLTWTTISTALHTMLIKCCVNHCRIHRVFRPSWREPVVRDRRLRCWTILMESLWRPISISMWLTMRTVVCNSFARAREMEAQWPGMDRTALLICLNQQELLLMGMDIFSLLISGIIALLDLIGTVFDVSSDVRKCLLQHPINWKFRPRWVSTRMETSSSQIMAIIEFKSSS